MKNRMINVITQQLTYILIACKNKLFIQYIIIQQTINLNNISVSEC